MFWTKNPEPLMNKLSALDKYNYYFQITMTPYEKDIEPFVREKREIIKAMTTLSKLIGKNRVIWRYDPILLNDKYTKKYHYEQFERAASYLSESIDRCIISFIDQYKEVKRNMDKLKLHNIESSEMLEIAEQFADIGRNYSIDIKSCAEPLQLSSVGVCAANCVDPQLIASIIGRPPIKDFKPDSIRTGCGCAKSVDIGDYNTLPLLIGNLCGDEKLLVHNLCRKPKI